MDIRNWVIALLTGLLIGSYARAETQPKETGVSFNVSLSDSNMDRFERSIVLNGLATQNWSPQQMLSHLKALGY